MYYIFTDNKTVYMKLAVQVLWGWCLVSTKFLSVWRIISVTFIFLDGWGSRESCHIYMNIRGFRHQQLVTICHHASSAVSLITIMFFIHLSLRGHTRCTDIMWTLLAGGWRPHQCLDSNSNSFHQILFKPADSVYEYFVTVWHPCFSFYFRNTPSSNNSARHQLTSVYSIRERSWRVAFASVRSVWPAEKSS